MYDYVVVDWDLIDWDRGLCDVLFTSQSLDSCYHFIDSHSGDFGELTILFGIEDLGF